MIFRRRKTRIEIEYASLRIEATGAASEEFPPAMEAGVKILPQAAALGSLEAAVLGNTKQAAAPTKQEMPS